MKAAQSGCLDYGGSTPVKAEKSPWRDADIPDGQSLVSAARAQACVFVDGRMRVSECARACVHLCQLVFPCVPMLFPFDAQI